MSTLGLDLTCRRVATVISDISVLLAVVANIGQQSDTLRTLIPRGGARNQASCHPALLNELSLMKYRELWLPGGSPNGPSQLPGDSSQQVGRVDLKAHKAGPFPSSPEEQGWTAQKDCA